MEHHPLNDEDLRFKQGYSKHNRPEYLKGLDLDRWAWQRKKRHFSQSMHLVAPSNWLADKARQSAITGNWPVTVIPNPLDTNTFKPIEKSLARTILNLPRDKKIVLVGAFGSVMNKNKGFDLLAGALHKLSLTETELKSGIHLVVFGQNQPVEPVVIPFPVTFMGHLSDDYSLSLLYNASDVVVVPSRMENLPQTATEAQACGIPVAAFNVCGIPDAVDHERTGFLAKGYDTDELAKGIAWILEDQDRYHQLSALARAKALSEWAPQLVVDRYLDVYRQAIDHHQSQGLQ
jgi:glycosyltransferase involved in cell wall biosynthesis